MFNIPLLLFRYLSSASKRVTCSSCEGQDGKSKRSNSGSRKNNKVVSRGTEARVLTSDTSTSMSQKTKVNGRSPPSSSCSLDEVNQVLFFPDTSLVTPSVKEEGGFNEVLGLDQEYPYSSKYLKKHHSDGPFSQLLNLILSAQTSLDLCIYVLSFPPLAEAILELYERSEWTSSDDKKLQIRIIVDGREDEAMNSQISRLSRKGIPIRCNEKSYSILMHNKFAIIDSKVVLTGSLNWTKTAVLLNYENVLITSTRSLVNRYQEHFNLLWSQFKPYGASSVTVHWIVIQVFISVDD